jgi:uncharacterized alpha-E superfamily protein
LVQTDISKIVITQIKERHAKFANLTYVVSDCRDMPEFLDCQFGHVVDKGEQQQQQQRGVVECTQQPESYLQQQVICDHDSCIIAAANVAQFVTSLSSKATAAVHASWRVLGSASLSCWLTLRKL